METDGFRFVALQFCAGLIAVFASQVFLGFEPAFNASESPWWKFFSSIVGHGGLEHLLNNLFFLGLFGSIYERLSSGKMFLFTFIFSAVLANFSAFIFFPNSYVVGASGGAFGVLAALAVYRPNRIGLALGVPLPMWASLLAYTLIQFAGLTGSSTTAFQAHLMGIAAGAPVGFTMRSGRNDVTEDLDRQEDENWLEKIRRWEEEYML